MLKTVGRSRPILQLSAFSFQLCLLAAALCISGCRKKAAATDFVVFDRNGGCVIAVPATPSEGEQRAAELIQATLAKAAGRPAADFPLLRQGPEGHSRSERAVIFVSGTNHRE